MPVFGKRYVDTITPQDIEAFALKTRDEGLAGKTVNDIVSVLLLGALVVFLRLRDKSCRLLAWQDTLAFVALAIFYPLAVVDVEWTAFWMQVFQVAILLYSCVLVVYFRIVPIVKGNDKLDSTPEGSHE